MRNLDKLVYVLEKRQKRLRGQSLHPLSLLESLMDKALLGLERAVRRAVETMVG